jgi:DNA-directed RNA polymerase sigma subunit (sigma70/sigma32)
MMRRKSQKLDLYEYTYEEIAQELGITPGRVRQILRESIAKVRRNPEHIEILREYMQ